MKHIHAPRASHPLVKALSLLTALAGLSCTTAHAQDAQPYLGIGAGFAQTQVGNHDYSAPALQILSGLQLHRNFALEFSYLTTTDFDKPGQDFSLTSIGASGVLLLPLGIGNRDSWTLYGKVGISQTSVLYSDSGNAATVDDFGLHYGAGVQYATSRSFALRLGRESRPYAYGSSSEDVTITTLSAIFRF